jgi:uncharacterized protein (DUF302 family)
MFAQIVRSFTAAALGCAVLFSAVTLASAESDGVVRARSAYPVEETIARLKQDIAAKGIMFFSEINQSELAAGADVELRPSTLLVFGNPPLGTQFLTSNPVSGLDWPVRLLVFEDADGGVWMAYSDFAWIARRHGIADRGPQFAMASEVIVSIVASAQSNEGP